MTEDTETDLRRYIKQLTTRVGARLYFTYRSRHSPAGWPDLQIVAGRRLYIAELKRGIRSQGGVSHAAPTDEQRAWLDALAGVDRVYTCLWRPGDLERIGAALTVDAEPPGLWVPGSGRLDEVRG